MVSDSCMGNVICIRGPNTLLHVICPSNVTPDANQENELYCFQVNFIESVIQKLAKDLTDGNNCNSTELVNCL